MSVQQSPDNSFAQSSMSIQVKFVSFRFSTLLFVFVKVNNYSVKLKAWVNLDNWHSTVEEYLVPVLIQQCTYPFLERWASVALHLPPLQCCSEDLSCVKSSWTWMDGFSVRGLPSTPFLLWFLPCPFPFWTWKKLVLLAQFTTYYRHFDNNHAYKAS